MWHLCWALVVLICQSKGILFIGKRFKSMPQSSNLSEINRIRGESELFFLRECESEWCFRKGMLWHSFKKNCIQGGLGEWKIPPTELS